MKKNYKILKDAREIVKSRWRRGNYGEKGGPRCMVGALAEASGLSPHFCEKYSFNPARFLLIVTCNQWTNPQMLFQFNDSSTKKEVVAAFTKAMRLAR